MVCVDLREKWVWGSSKISYVSEVNPIMYSLRRRFGMRSVREGR